MALNKETKYFSLVNLWWFLLKYTQYNDVGKRITKQYKQIYIYIYQQVHYKSTGSLA